MNMKQFMARKVSSEYILGDSIGRGQFGEVFIARHCKTNQLCVCKSIVSSSGDVEKSLAEARGEALAVCHVDDHPNIVKLLDYFEEGTCFHLLMELCPLGDLFHYIFMKGKLEEETCALIVLQIASALYHCHTRNIMHRDVKLENIMVLGWKRSSVTGREYPIVKLTDFGSSVVIEPGMQIVGMAGTIMYVAPEVLTASSPLSFQADVWSLGVVLFAALSGKFPYPGTTKEQLQKSIGEKKRIFVDNVSKEAMDLISWMLEPNPETRAHASEVLTHPWILRHAPALGSEPASGGNKNIVSHYVAGNALKLYPCYVSSK